MDNNPFVMVLLSLCGINQTQQDRAISCLSSISVISSQLAGTLQCKINAEFCPTYLDFFLLCKLQKGLKATSKENTVSHDTISNKFYCETLYWIHRLNTIKT